VEPTIGKPTIWVDSNVLVEAYSQGDLHQDAHRGPKVIDGRRLLLQGSLWLAMALDALGATTLSFKHECLATTQRIAKRGTPAGESVVGVLSILSPHVFPAWRALITDADAALPVGKEGNNLRDALMVKLCAEHGLSLITRDVNRKRAEPSPPQRARDSGVAVSTPEAFAETVLARDVARTRFMERLAVGVRKRAEAYGPDVDRRSIEREMVLMQEIHRRIWLPPGAPLPPFDG
jgi:predicted nucleic acid-binding protein